MEMSKTPTARAVVRARALASSTNVTFSIGNDERTECLRTLTPHWRVGLNKKRPAGTSAVRAFWRIEGIPKSA
jgi:hypothetical protein